MHATTPIIRRPNDDRLRQGSIVPVVAVALVVVLGALALVLDRAWIDAAQVELATAADAAALAAARELVSDDCLQPGEENCPARVTAAREAAAFAAAANLVAGQAVEVAPSDVHFGRLVSRGVPGTKAFLETEREPDSVVVYARLNRRRGNPVALLMRSLTGQPSAELAALAQATLDNRVVALRPQPLGTIPALPLAILECDDEGECRDTWQEQIVAEKGSDRFSFDAVANEVTASADGIPEISLEFATSTEEKGASTRSNARLIEFGSRPRRGEFAARIRRGLTLADLSDSGGVVWLDGRPVQLSACCGLTLAEWQALQSIAGSARICLLFRYHPGERDEVSLSGAVAGRIVNLQRVPGQPPRIVFQPAVLLTPAAVTIVDEASLAMQAGTTRLPRNPYIYRLTLTR